MPDKKFGVGVGVLLIKEGKVLLGKRHDDPEKASSLLQGQGTWTMPGGKLDFGETLAECACREAREETGLMVNSQDLSLISLGDDIKGDAHFTTIGFICEKFQGEPQVKEPDEIVEWRWFTLDNLPSPMFPPSEKVLTNYFKKVIYMPKA